MRSSSGPAAPLAALCGAVATMTGALAAGSGAATVAGVGVGVAVDIGAGAVFATATATAAGFAPSALHALGSMPSINAVARMRVFRLNIMRGSSKIGRHVELQHVGVVRVEAAGPDVGEVAEL